MIGKYEIIAQPIAGSAHMLRYTVFVGGRRIGATASMPTESDCRYLERPPVVPPLKPFQVFYRPGRPKKGATPPQPGSRRAPRHAARRHSRRDLDSRPSLRSEDG